MITERIGKNNKEIFYQINGLSINDFQKEGDFLIFNKCYESEGVHINYRIKLTESFFQNRRYFSSPKSIFKFIPGGNNKFTMLLNAKIGKYSTSSKGERFYYYNVSNEQYFFSFKMLETKEKAFDLLVIPKTKSPKTDTPKPKKKKRKKLTSEQAKQKWLINHPFQGGGFSPR